MTFLTDEELAQLVKSTAPLARPIKDDGFKDRASAVQACSLDLTVGEIYVPGVADTKPGGAVSPRTSISLEEGQTAMIRTHESLDLPDDIGAIGFPPSSVSIQGLLMTNPGHIDPGYRGHMHFTVINMARENINLKKGDKIVTILFFRLPKSVAAPFYKRRGSRLRNVSPITAELLHRLSHDFLNIGERAGRAAQEAVAKTEFRMKVFVPIFTAIATIVLSYFAAVWQVKGPLENQLKSLEQSVARLDGRLSGLGGSINLGALESRIKALVRNPLKLHGIRRQ